MNTFSVGETIRFAWESFKKRPWFFVGVTLLVMILSGIISMITEMFGDEDLMAVVGAIINIVLSTFIGIGTTALYLHAHESIDAVESKELWHPAGFWNYLAATLLIGIVVVLGFILLIVPGVIVALMLMFATYLIVDRKLGPIEAMKESRRITKGHLLDLFLLMLAIIGINILGLLALVVGLLVTIPMTSLALVHAYRTLEHQASEVVPATPVASA